MLQIHRKYLPFPDFEARVDAFRQAKLAHQQTVDVPAPVEHHLVEAAIERVSRSGEPDDYRAAYEIVEPTLAEKKQDLDHALHKARDAALFGKLSSAKRRLLSLHVADVEAKKASLWAAHTESTKDIVAKPKDEWTDNDRARLAKNPEDQLTEADRLILAKRDEIIAYDQKIERHAAKLHAQVEDLTVAEVDLWKPEPFPT